MDPGETPEEPALEPSDTEAVRSPLDDIPVFLASTHRGVAMAHELLARRPSRTVLGEILGDFMKLVSTVVEIGRRAGTIDDIELRPAPPDELENRYFWNPWMPLKHSLCRHDLDLQRSEGWAENLLVNDFGDDFGRPLFFAHRLFDAAIDHLTGLAVLLQTEGAIRSPLALSRVALEAASRAWYLLDEGVTPRDRFWRALNAELEINAEANKAARKQGDDETMRETGIALRTLLKDAKRFGAKSDEENGQMIAPYLRANAIVDALLDQIGGSTYHSLSQMVHSQEDEGFGLTIGVHEPETPHPQRDRLICLQLLPAIIAIFQALRRLAAYTGWDLSAVFELEAGQVNMWAAASGLRDAEIESQILSEGWEPPENGTVEFWRRVHEAAQVDDQTEQDG